MDVSRITLQYRKLNQLISEKKVKQSLDILHDMLKSVMSGDLHDEYENLVMTYRNMLAYTIDGVKDPERNKIYTKLIQSILGLSDRVKQDILSRNSGWHTYWIKQQTEKEFRLSGKTIVETLDDLIFKSELDDWLRLSREAIQNKGAVKRNHIDFQPPARNPKLVKSIFNHLWLTDQYGDAENTLIDLVNKSDNFFWYDKSLFATAVTLSAMRTWNPEKLFRLIDMYLAGEEKVKERALTGLIFCMHYFNARIIYYPEVLDRLKLLATDPGFREHSRIIVLQMIRSRETERLGRKLRDEILPKVEKLKPKIEEKLDLENILPKYKSNEKNPDWSDVFSESEDIYKTMEELTRLQMEGADVYMTAFANMKHFDFFKDFQNWFMPFHPDHETIDEIYRDEILGPGTNDLAEALYKTPFICNSDKYSLLLNLKNLPSTQKTMMLKVFKMELEGLQQLNEEESATDPWRNFRVNATQYIQDVYRFFKLSPYRKEFEDLFTGKLDIYNSRFFGITFEGTDAERGIADYFFSKDFYDDALNLYLKKLAEKPGDPELCEKIAYCCQEKKDYLLALEYYRKAEIIDRKPWTVKKIGYCLRKLGRTPEALDYYLQAIGMEADNMHSVMMAGHCYLDLGQYEEALRYYFRIEYAEPGNLKILRPIAYCYLALGRFDESEKYYDRLAHNKLNAHDQINRGHVALCKGDKREAINYYRQSILGGELTKAEFISIYNNDTPLLLSHGVEKDDLPIILDYLLFVTDQP